MGGEKVEAGTILFQWDPYTDVILARKSGFVELKDFIENETFQVEAVEGGKKQMVIVESKDRNLSPHVEIVDKDGSILAGGTGSSGIQKSRGIHSTAAHPSVRSDIRSSITSKVGSQKNKLSGFYF